MLERTFGEMADLCEVLGGIALSLEGTDEFDEIRIMCMEDRDGVYRANWVAHNRDGGGFTYGGQSGHTFGDSAAEALEEPFRAVFTLDGFEDFTDVEFELYGMHDLDNPSEAELMYGSEAWNAYDRGFDVR